MKRTLIVLMAAAIPAAAALFPVAAGAVTLDSRPSTGAPICAPGPVSAPAGTKVESIVAVPNAGGTITFPSNPPFPDTPPISGVPAFCDVNVTVTHPGANDHVTIKLLLPQDPKQWNGRFQGTGGSAFLAGYTSDPSVPLISALKSGYAGAATDAGVGANPLSAAWGLTADGRTDTGLLTNFATRSIHDMAVIGKDFTHKFYERAVRYSYFTGCSTGGRQGYAEAQNFPNDFQGILANAPAIEWNRFEIATLWSQAVFHSDKVAPSACEMNEFTKAAVAACDSLDGSSDGVIDNPQDCKWDARSLVGKKVVCAGQETTISRALASAVNKIWAGPVTLSGRKLWYGQSKGSDFGSIAAAGTPFLVPDQWAKYFVTRNPSFDATKLTYASFERLFTSATQQFDRAIGTNDPDLSTFAKAGGKLLTWHGQADQLIPTQGTVDYRKRVNAELGGNKRVDDFYRLFLLPGVDHCGSPAFSTGGLVNPGADLTALVNWVEKGQAPATLPTTTAAGATEDVCRYPTVNRNNRCIHA